MTTSHNDDFHMFLFFNYNFDNRLKVHECNDFIFDMSRENQITGLSLITIWN